MSFAFDQLPAELRLEIWGFAVHAGARRRLVIEQSSQVFPTLDLVASPLFSVNAESRDVAMAFYPVRLAVYRRRQSPESWPYEPTAPETEDARGPGEFRGMIYLCPQLDVLDSLYPYAGIQGLDDIAILGTHDMDLAFDRSERSKRAALHHRAEAMGEDALRLFRRLPDRLCLMKYGTGRLGVRDWMAVDEWMQEFGEEEYRNLIAILRLMRLNSSEFVHVFGW